VVLNPTGNFDGGGLFLRDPVRLPSVLRHLGRVGFQTMLARSEDSGNLRDPYFWTARATVMPHRRFTVGVNRAALFGGEGNYPLTLRNVANVIIGAYAVRNQALNFEDQVASVDARWRLPGPLPVEVYGEWGLEDAAGAWRDVPGIVAGAHLPAVPGVPQLSLAVERASFAPKCCGNPEWYSHRLAFWKGWVQDGEPLGHPLAGEGTEWRVRSDGAFSDARLRLGADLFARDRGAENILAPNREGTSRGGELRLDLSLGSSATLVARGLLERGETEWEETDAQVGLRWSF
jgi:hypothetical protein